MNNLNEKIATQARTWLGTKYHHQGRLKKSEHCQGGVDCLGLLIGIINELDIRNDKGELLSKYDTKAYEIHAIGEKLLLSIELHLKTVSFEKMIPGDVLLFKLWQEPQHVGILTNYFSGGFGFIHCDGRCGQVVEQPLSQAWQRMISYVYRFQDI